MGIIIYLRSLINKSERSNYISSLEEKNLR